MSLLIIICSCAKNGIHSSANSEFESKYSKEVEFINSSRKEPVFNSDIEAQKIAQKKRAPTAFEDPATIMGLSGNDKLSSAKVDTSKLQNIRPQNFTPDAQTFNDGQAFVAKNNLPADIFDLIYITETSPPFAVSGLTFDVIQIPERDFFGVKSTLNDKKYLLVGNEALQRNIDQINDGRTQDDIELSEIIIREQKEIRKQRKIAKVFSEDASIIAAEKIKEESVISSQNEARKKKLQEEDPLKKSIALQIVQQNLKQNAPADPNNPNAQATQTQ